MGVGPSAGGGAPAHSPPQPAPMSTPPTPPARQEQQQQQRDAAAAGRSSLWRWRRPRSGHIVVRASLIGPPAAGKSVLIDRVFRGVAAQQCVQRPYVPTSDSTFVPHREGLESTQLWEAPTSARFRTVTTTYIRGCTVCVLCFALSDPHALRDLDYFVDEARASSVFCDDAPTVLLGLRGDEPRAISLDEVCAFAEKHRVRCFGSDVAALPIAYDDWAGGAVPASRSGSGGMHASEYGASDAAQHVDWRAAFRQRAKRTGFGAASVCRTPVIEFSSATASDEQAAWLAHLLHDLTIENSLMDVAIRNSMMADPDAQPRSSDTEERSADDAPGR